MYTRNRLQKVSTHKANNEANAVAPVPIEEDRFEFKKILDRKKTGNTVFYLIKWRGYHKKYATWEKRSELIKDIPQAVLNYEKKYLTV